MKYIWPVRPGVPIIPQCIVDFRGFRCYAEINFTEEDMLKFKDMDKKAFAVKICIIIVIGALLFLALIMPLRGVMNAVSRIDFIAQRLDDYPRMYANNLQETEEWWNWWMTEDYGSRARQAAFIYAADKNHETDEEKLEYIARTLGAEKAEIVSRADYEDVSTRNSADGLSTCSAELKDGRLLVLGLHSSLREDRMAFVEDEDYFLSQLQAGLPGYIAVIRNGELSLYPKDENEASLRGMIGTMIANGRLDPAALKQKAKKDPRGTSQEYVINKKAGGIPAAKYILYCAAYADSTDFVINVAELSELVRFGRKRSWSLWFLVCAAMVLLVRCLWNTKMYKMGIEPSQELTRARRRSSSVMILASLLIFASVTMIQVLSGVNLSQQGATDEAAFLKSVLGRESERGAGITDEFDTMYHARARTAASILSANPQLADTDSLLSLDQALGGAGLRVFDINGKLLATDEVLHQAVNESLTDVSVTGASHPNSTAAAKEKAFRYYRTALTDDEGRTTGWVELCVELDQLDMLLMDTRLSEVVGDLHILDTLHVVVVENDQEGRIVASTWKNWIGDRAAEHGIHSQYLYDGYEGIVDFDGNRCYSVAFAYDDNYVIVGSENTSALVSAGGVAVLSILLILVLLLVVHRPLVREICEYQEKDFIRDTELKNYHARSDYPGLWQYFTSFMLAVFLLTAILYFSTKGDPAGLTYNIVRGTWVRGINAATVTTCIMLASVVFAVQKLAELFLLRLGKYMNPKGMTICKLIDSGLTYVTTIVMILYALSMFGVNAKTLLNGVGVTALIFTLGANSLIADVLAGLFIIFEGDFTVGDVVVIDGFRGIVQDISMRTTKLMDDNTRDIMIIGNSKISELINQSRESSVVIIDIPISYDLVGQERGEEILKEAISKLPDKFPGIIGEPQYWGVSELPEKNKISGVLSDFKARVAFDCHESDKEMLTYKIYRELVELVTILNSHTQSGPAKAVQHREPTKVKEATDIDPAAKVKPATEIDSPTAVKPATRPNPRK